MGRYILVIQACIADLTEGLKRFYAFGVIVAIFTIAYVPFAQLSNHLLNTYPELMTPTTVGVIAMLLSLLTVLLGWSFSNPSLYTQQKTHPTIGDIVENFMVTFSNPKLCALFSTLVLFQFSWGLYFQNLYYYLNQFPQYTPQTACLFNVSLHYVSYCTPDNLSNYYPQMAITQYTLLLFLNLWDYIFFKYSL